MNHFRREDGTLNPFGVILCVVAAVVLISKATSETKPPGTNLCSPDGTAAAFAMSHELVRRQLKAPSTADFPWTFSNRDGIQVLHVGGCKFEVTSYVDAENSFGGTKRTNYLAALEYVPATDKWEGNAEIFE